jgi:hypothetical protein
MGSIEQEIKMADAADALVALRVVAHLASADALLDAMAQVIDPGWPS